MMSNSSSNNSGCLILIGTIGAAIIGALGVAGAAFVSNVDKFAPKTVTATSTVTPPASIIKNKLPIEVQVPSPSVVITPSPVVVDETKTLKEQLIGEWKASSESCNSDSSLLAERSITYYKNGTIVENSEIRDIRSYPNLFSIGKRVLRARLEIVPDRGTS
jgi:hypothetical protein